MRFTAKSFACGRRRVLLLEPRDCRGMFRSRSTASPLFDAFTQLDVESEVPQFVSRRLNRRVSGDEILNQDHLLAVRRKILRVSNRQVFRHLLRQSNSRAGVILSTDQKWVEPDTRTGPKYSQAIAHSLLQEIEQNRCGPTLEELLACRGTAGPDGGNLFSRSATGDQADDLQFRQGWVGTHIEAQAIAAPGNCQDDAIITYLRLCLDIDDRLYA